MEFEEKAQEFKFIMFENKLNNCWLDASMALIAHNKVIKKLASTNPSSKLYEIVSTYSEAISILNNSNSSIELRMKTAREILQKIQISILQYLKPMLKSKNGEPDSAFCALLNLINENKPIKENLKITWLWKKKCSECNTSKLIQKAKPIITLSKVNYFEPDYPASIYMCSCKKELEMKLIYQELPSCLFFHFENGAGKAEIPPLIFTIQDRKYQLTGVITLQKSQDATVNHFVTWIRRPSSNKWLECNDLNDDVLSFSSELPKFHVSDVYMYAYETFDNLGKIQVEVSADHMQEQDESTSFELIDLSNESEDVKETMENKLKNAEIASVNLLASNILHHSNQVATEEEKPTKELDKLDSTSTCEKECPTGLKMDNGKISASSNEVCVKDNKEVLSSGEEKTKKSKMNYNEGGVKNVRCYKQSKNFDMKMYKAPSLSQFKRTKKFVFHNKTKAVEESFQVKENNQMPQNEKKSILSKLLSEKIIVTILPNKTPKQQGYNLDMNKKLVDMQPQSHDKNKVFIVNQPHGSFVSQDLNPLQRNLAEQSAGSKNELSNTYPQESNLCLKIPNTPISRLSYERNILNNSIQQADKNNKDDIPSQVNTSSSTTQSRAKMSIFSSSKSGLELVKCQSNKLMNTNDSPIKSTFDRKRKYSKQQSFDTSNEEVTVPSNIKKLQKICKAFPLIKTEENGENNCKERDLQVKMQQTSMKKVYNDGTRNEKDDEEDIKNNAKKLKTGGVKKHNTSSEHINSEDINTPLKKDKVSRNAKRSPQKFSRKSEKKKADQRLEQIIDTTVEKTIAAFLEQIFHKHDIGI